MRTSGSAYGVAIDSMISRGGVIPTGHFASISGSPIRLRKHVANEHLLANLEKLELLARTTFDGIGEALVVRGYGEPTALHTLRARLIVEDILLSHLADWLRKTSMVSWGKTKTRSAISGSGFGQHEWDLSAPSYAHPFKGYSKGRPNPGFVVADVLLGKQLERNAVQYFIKKCDALRTQKAIRPFMAIFVASGFSKDAFQAGKKAGLLFVTPQALFGAEIGEALGKLLDTLTNAAAAAKQPDVVAELFSKLSVIEGAASNLRGPLFELIVAYLVRAKEAGTIEIGNIVRDPDPPNKTVEIDVLLVQGRAEIKAYECKGKLGNLSVTKAEAMKWLTEQVPVIRRAFLAQPRYANAKFSFELWTTGKFAPDAVQYLKEQQAQTKKFSISWKDGTAVIDAARDQQASSIIKTLNEHYAGHPLAKQGDPCI
jgi:hypothetical protein